MKTQMFKLDQIITNKQLLSLAGIDEKEDKKVTRWNWYDAALDNFKEYLYTVYEVEFN